MGRPTKEEAEKKKKAKERVEALLEGVNINTKDKKVVTDRVVELEEKKGNEWLESEMTRVTDENDRLIKELATAKDDLKKMAQELLNAKGGVPTMDGSVVQKNVVAMFKELENNFLGRNPQKQRYEQANIKHLLDNMLRKFPFIRSK